MIPVEIDTTNRDRYKPAWIELFRNLNAVGNSAARYYDLKQMYGQHGRRYHTWEHILFGLDEFEVFQQATGLARNPDAIILAYCYHDSVYNLGPGIKDSDNVDQSAKHATTVLRQARLPETLIKTVANLILVTKHTVPPNGIDEEIMADIDLASLGKPADEFDKDGANIRAEYSWVTDEAYRAGRLGILEGFLKRRPIYHTAYFREKYEAQARENLERAIDNFRSF